MSLHNLGAEQSVLGGVMLDATAWDRVAGSLTGDDSKFLMRFGRSRNRPAQ